METIAEIKARLEAAPMDALADTMEKYRPDERSGVKKLLVQYQQKLDALAEEKNRIEGMKYYEKRYRDCACICGIDEAGRGPLAGPVVAAAVIFPKDTDILYVNDSKKLSEKKREELYDVIMEKALTVGVGIVGPDVIDEMNILQATYEAMRIAVSELDPQPELLLNDAVTIPKVMAKQVPIIKGDAKSISIASASIIAKVTRDRLMREYDKLFPEYGFAKHKGYGSAAHIAKIREYGPCAIHRQTFIRQFVESENYGE